MPSKGGAAEQCFTDVCTRINFVYRSSASAIGKLKYFAEITDE